MIFQFLDSGYRTAAENMAVDEILARGVGAGKYLPTLRVYAWRPNAISLGFHQNIDEFDLAAIGENGLQIVRRPTGGRAILHADELTYSITMSAEPMGPREIYRWINIGLLRGLETMGINATLARADDPFRSLYRRPDSIPCFASSARSEIQVNGRKLIGSAQRRYGNAILQHGSLLLDSGHRMIVRYLAAHLDAHRKQMETTLLEKTTDARMILGRSVSYEEAAAALRKGFSEALGISFHDVESRTLELQQSELLELPSSTAAL
jgi:lipoyl(octanoyl) transferase